MSVFYTSNTLIEAIKRKALIPTSQTTFKDADFLAFADEELSLGLVPTIMKVNEDYFLYTEKIPLVQGQNAYQIPYRAIGNKLRDVCVVDSSGNVGEMTRIGIGDLPSYQGSFAQSTAVYAFYISNNEIVLVPADSNMPSGASLLVSYYMRPNALVLMNQVSPITAIDRETGVISVSNIPADFTAELLFDFVQYRSPHKTLNYDVAAISVNPTLKTITFDIGKIPAQLSVGDHICMATTSAIPQVPSDLHVVLAHRASARCLEALGDSEGLKNSNAKLQELEAQTMHVIDDRVDDAPMKAVNRRSTLSRGLNSRRGNRRW